MWQCSFVYRIRDWPLWILPSLLKFPIHPLHMSIQYIICLVHWSVGNTVTIYHLISIGNNLSIQFIILLDGWILVNFLLINWHLLHKSLWSVFNALDYISVVKNWYFSSAVLRKKSDKLVKLLLTNGNLLYKPLCLSVYLYYTA